MTTTWDIAAPHSYLGAHETKAGVVVRALRPEAESVRVEPAGVELEDIGGGVWEGVVPDVELPYEYELVVSYPDGNSGGRVLDDDVFEFLRL